MVTSTSFKICGMHGVHENTFGIFYASPDTKFVGPAEAVIIEVLNYRVPLWFK